MKKIRANYILCMCMMIVSVGGGVFCEETNNLGGVATKLFNRDSALDMSNDLTKVIPNSQKTVPVLKDVHDGFYDSTGLHSQHEDIVKTIQLDSSRKEREKRHHNSAHHRRCHPKVEYDPEHEHHYNSYHYHYYYGYGDKHNHKEHSDKDTDMNEGSESKDTHKDKMVDDKGTESKDTHNDKMMDDKGTESKDMSKDKNMNDKDTNLNNSDKKM